MPWSLHDCPVSGVHPSSTARELAAMQLGRRDGTWKLCSDGLLGTAEAVAHADELLRMLGKLELRWLHRHTMTAILVRHPAAFRVEVLTHLRAALRTHAGQRSAALGVARGKVEAAYLAAVRELRSQVATNAAAVSAAATARLVEVRCGGDSDSPAVGYLKARAAGAPPHLAVAAAKLLTGRCVWDLAVRRVRLPSVPPRAVRSICDRAEADLRHRVYEAARTPTVIAVPAGALALPFFPHAWPLAGAIASPTVEGTHHRFGVVPAVVASGLADLTRTVDRAWEGSVKVLGPFVGQLPASGPPEAWEVAAELWSPELPSQDPAAASPLEQAEMLLR